MVKKLQPIKEAPPLKNVAKLTSYLRLLNCYGQLLPGRATRLAPLYKLSRQEVPWEWQEEQTTAFQKSKKDLQSDNVLVHLNLKLELSLACDASSYEVGAVLSHHFSDGFDKPIAVVSQSLAPAEVGNAKINKEALAIGFGIRKFHQYLCGREFLIYTYHKPLVTLLGEKNGVPVMASRRLQRLPTATCPASTYGPYDAVLSVHILEVIAAEPVTTS